jgi:hypothetical protein
MTARHAPGCATGFGRRAYGSVTARTRCASGGGRVGARASQAVRASGGAGADARAGGARVAGRATSRRVGALPKHLLLVLCLK